MYIPFSLLQNTKGDKKNNRGGLLSPLPEKRKGKNGQIIITSSIPTGKKHYKSPTSLDPA